MVKGSSSLDELEGKMLTLKVYVDGEMRSIDSTRVVHGRFSFGGGMDSTMLANVFWGNVSLMPIVLEPAHRSTTRCRALYKERHSSMHRWQNCHTSMHR